MASSLGVVLHVLLPSEGNRCFRRQRDGEPERWFSLSSSSSAVTFRLTTMTSSSSESWNHNSMITNQINVIWPNNSREPFSDQNRHISYLHCDPILQVPPFALTSPFLLPSVSEVALLLGRPKGGHVDSGVSQRLVLVPKQRTRQPLLKRGS